MGTTLAQPGYRSDLLGLLPDELGDALASLSCRPYVAQQVFRWIHAARVVDFQRMTNLARPLRQRLGETFRLALPDVSDRVEAPDGTTRYAYRLDDDERTESVFIPGRPGQATLCLSSQVGCPLACTFCVSGLAGVRRDLSAGEMVGQALAMLHDREPLARTNIVFMGMGEALLNFDNLVRAFSILAHPSGAAIPLRRMTVSTAGHVSAMERFAALGERPRLAISLNATSDDVRSRIMPINRSFPLARLLAACRSLPLGRGERITFEYVLLAGVNDRDEDRRRLPRLLGRLPCKVNLIPWNTSAGLPYQSPSESAVDEFAASLSRHGLTVTVRRRRGADAGAACGQLALLRPPETAP